MVLGIAGKACSGKNEVASLIESRGFRSIDIDKLGHIALEENCSKIIEKFGKKILNKDKKIDRIRLGAVVFKNRKKLKALEAIVHPAVFDMVKKILNDSAGENMILNSALLGLTGLDKLCDKVIWVETPLCIRVKRAFKRDKNKLSHIFSRIRSQLALTVQHFSSGVDIYMVRNKGSLADLEMQIKEFLKSPENYKRV